MAVDEFDGNPFGPGVDYAVPPGPMGGGVIYVTETGALDPSVTITDQAGNVIYAPSPPTPAEAGGDIDLEFHGDNPLLPTPPGQPGPPTQPEYAGPPEIFQSGPPTLDEGGPEDTAPPTDFDTPLPTEAPPGQPPALPPLEGEYIPREAPGEHYSSPPIIEGESYDITREPRQPIPGGRRGTPARSRQRGAMEKELGAPRPLYPYGQIPEGIDSPLPPFDLERGVLRGIGRIVLGPAGSVIGDILAPEVFGSGELPFPPLPQVSIPAPDVRFPTLPSWGLPEPMAPEIDHPPVPDVITVTPEDSWPESDALPTTPAATAPMPTPSPVPSPTRGLTPGLWALIGAALGRLLAPKPRPIFQGLIDPASPIEQPLTPAQPMPLTPPTPTPGAVDVGGPITDPLTPVLSDPLPSAQPSGPLARIPLLSETSDDRCRCKKCKDQRQKKRKKSPSDTIAHMKPFNRRMSTYSLKNLRRGAK